MVFGWGTFSMMMVHLYKLLVDIVPRDGGPTLEDLQSFFRYSGELLLERIKSVTARSSFGIEALKVFRWFLPRAQREAIDFSIGDLVKDRAEMKRKGIHVCYIQTALIWAALRTIIPIMWDGIKAIARELMPFKGIISQLFKRD